MRVFVDPEITFEVINPMSIFYEEILNQFYEAKQFGIALLFPVAKTKGGGWTESRCPRLNGLLWNYPAGMAFKMSNEDMLLGGFQQVPRLSDDYTMAIEAGDNLTFLAGPEIINVEDLEASIERFFGIWNELKNYDANYERIFLSAIINWMFFNAYKADAILTKNYKVIQLFSVIQDLTNHGKIFNIPKFHILELKERPSIEEIVKLLLINNNYSSFFTYDAFVRTFGDLSHNFFKAILPKGELDSAEFAGEITLQPNFGAKFKGSVQIRSSKERLGYEIKYSDSQVPLQYILTDGIFDIIGQLILNHKTTENELKIILENLNKILSILGDTTNSIHSIHNEIKQLIAKCPEAKPLFLEIINGASGSLLAANIIEAIKLALF